MPTSHVVFCLVVLALRCWCAPQVQKVVPAFVMLYCVGGHLYRMLTDYGGWARAGLGAVVVGACPLRSPLTLT